MQRSWNSGLRLRQRPPRRLSPCHAVPQVHVRFWTITWESGARAEVTRDSNTAVKEWCKQRPGYRHRTSRTWGTVQKLGMTILIMKHARVS